MGRTVLGLCILAVVLAASSLGVAQTTAKLSGVLTDESGGVLPGAQITIKNVATGIQRSVVTDARGQYVAPSLAPGEYEITATMTGFETLVQKGIELAVGQTADINLRMKVGEVASRVEVTGEAPIVDTSTSAVAGVVEEKRILDLPLNGRDFSQLALVQPGAVSIRNASTTPGNKGYGATVSLGGSRPDQTAWFLDGTNIKNLAGPGTPGSAAGLMLGVDAIREFQVLVSDYSAEFGFTSGGVVNMVTKSGANGLHGTLYEFLRNSDLDARNFFDRGIPAFKRNQFGFSVGGPIRKDKAFFFGNYEGVRQRLGLTPVAIVPDANVHQGLIAGPGGTLQRVQVAPEIRPYLDLWPLPNGPSLGGGLADLFSAANEPVSENYFMARVDYHISDSQSIFSRFTFDQGSDSKPDTVPSENLNYYSRPRYTVVQYDKIFSPKLLSTTRVAANRSVTGSGVLLNINYPLNLFIFDKRYPPNLTIPGATTFGPSERAIASRTQNLYQFTQSIVYTRSRHAYKFGFDFEHVGTNYDGGPTDDGTFSWGSISDFLTDGPFDVLSVAVPGSTSQRAFVQNVFGAYFQDDWKVRQNLTVNLGLRYEPWTVPAEKHNRVSIVKDWVHATKFDVGVPFWENPSKKNFSPRVGFSWDPKGDGKTAVRAGFGIFFVDMLASFYGTTSTKNPPFAAFLRSPVGNLATVSSTVAQLGPTLLNPTFTPNTFLQIDQHYFNSMYEMKFNFAIQRQLPGDVSLTVGYLGDRGVHGWRGNDANTAPTTYINGRGFVAPGTPRLNPLAGVGTYYTTDSQLFYNALQVEVRKRFSRGFQFQSSYTWSRAVDDSGSGTAGGDFRGQPPVAQDPYQTKGERGLSPLHLEHNFVVNGTYAIPSPAGSGFSSHILGGWELSSILSLSTGASFTVNTSGRNAPNLSEQTGNQRPDLLPGRSSSSMILGKPTQYFDPTAFVLPPPGFYGNLGRGTLIGPGFASLDMSVTKSTHLPITEASRLEFRADFFNLANRANFAIPSSTQVLNPTNGQYIAGAGRITTTVGSSRQLQFGLKVIF